MTDDLVAFLKERLDEDEQTAKSAQRSTGHRDKPEGYAAWRAADDGSGVWGDHVSLAVGSYGFMDDELAAHIACHDPARVLADVDAKRELLDTYAQAAQLAPKMPGATAVEVTLRPILRKMATAYRGLPNYRPEWAPDMEGRSA